MTNKTNPSSPLTHLDTKQKGHSGHTGAVIFGLGGSIIGAFLPTIFLISDSSLSLFGQWSVVGIITGSFLTVMLMFWYSEYSEHSLSQDK